MSESSAQYTLRSTRVLLPGGIQPADVHVRDGRILSVAIRNESPALEDGVITDEEIRAAVAAVIEDEPSDEDLRAVSVRLAAAGWPLEGTFGTSDG